MKKRRELEVIPLYKIVVVRTYILNFLRHCPPRVRCTWRSTVSKHIKLYHYIHLVESFETRSNSLQNYEASLIIYPTPKKPKKKRPKTKNKHTVILKKLQLLSYCGDKVLIKDVISFIKHSHIGINNQCTKWSSMSSSKNNEVTIMWSIIKLVLFQYYVLCVWRFSVLEPKLQLVKKLFLLKSQLKSRPCQ